VRRAVLLTWVVVHVAGVAVVAGDRSAAADWTVVGAADRQQRGRPRDPFVSVLVPATAPETPREAPVEGLLGLAADDAVVSGLLTCGSGALAILAGPDGAMYVVRRSDRLRDAVIEDIDAGGVVFRVTTRNAAGVETTRRVRTRPGPADGGGQ